jgi:hypothetical protein
MSEKPRTEMLDMTDERKARLILAASRVVKLLKEELPNPIEAHIVLKLCMESLRVQFGILDTILDDYETQVKQ